jgi:MFS family permease
MYGIATVAAPLMGGAFVTRLSWRWCFYINLPFGAITLVVLGFLFDSPKQCKASTLSLKEKFQQLDSLGTVVLIIGIACLLLALQWGGTRFEWSNGRIIALLVLFGMSMIAFIVIQVWKQESATIPPRIFKQRSVAFSAWHVFAAGAAMNTLEYFVRQACNPHVLTFVSQPHSSRYGSKP